VGDRDVALSDLQLEEEAFVVVAFDGDEWPA
jgi:hypothetical protein